MGSELGTIVGYPSSPLILNMLIIIWVNVTGGVATNTMHVFMSYLGVTYISKIEFRALIHILDK